VISRFSASWILVRAYDRVDKKMLQYWMQDGKTDRNHNRVMRLIYSFSAKNTIEYGSHKIHAHRGVTQRGVLSPILFNYYLDCCLQRSPNLREAMSL
jgi:hypothetical protein